MPISNYLFAILYSVYSFFIFNVPLFKKYYLAVKPLSLNNIAIGFVLLFVVICLTIYFFSLIFQKKITKFFAILFLIISSFASYFILAYNIPIDEDMVGNVFATDVFEARDLLSLKLFFFVLIFGVMPSIFIYFLKIEYKKQNLKKLKFFAITFPLCILLVFSMYFKIAGFLRVNDDMEDFFAPFNYTLPVFVITKNKIKSKFFLQNTKEKEIILNVKNLDQNLNIVFIVGETARKKNFSLYNYERNTNPELLKIKELKILNAISCGTSTRVSIPCIFTKEQGYKSYLKSLSDAGVFVKWYENNYGGCYEMCEGSKIKTYFTNHEKCEGSCPDGDIFNEFYKDFNAKNSGLNLFVLHQNGSHGPLYYKRYPKEFAKFQPECKTANVAECTKEELINAYDNTILYTDFLISELILKVKTSKKPTIVIFISDHGESLGENGIFLHGFPYSIAPREQKEIPFLIWSSFEFPFIKKEEYTHKDSMNIILSLLKATEK